MHHFASGFLFFLMRLEQQIFSNIVFIEMYLRNKTQLFR